MKRIIWFGGLVAIAAGFLAINAMQADPVVSTDIAAMPVLTRNEQIADRIQIVHAGTILNLERRGQVWGLAQHGGYPVHPAMAQRLMTQLLALRLSHPNAPGHTELRPDDPRRTAATDTGVRVLASTGASLGAIVVADHAPGVTQFAAHQIGDPRDWQATGALDASAELLAWIDTGILTFDSARVAGGTLTKAGESTALDATQAGTRLATLADLRLTDVRPAAQVMRSDTGRMTVTLKDGGVLTVSIEADGDACWVSLTASGTAADGLHIPPGDWAFRYPAAALAVLAPA